jgi:hypothetical protein
MSYKVKYEVLYDNWLARILLSIIGAIITIIGVAVIHKSTGALSFILGALTGIVGTVLIYVFALREKS